MDFDYEDAYELEADIYSKNSKTPHQIMEHKFINVHNRNWKTYLSSIEWDGLWLKHPTEEERLKQKEEIEERKRQIEMETNPFKQWF